MKDFHHSFICRSTETGKKGHKNKHHSNKNEVCKCYAPFLKLHYYDCPVARKPCPIHGCPHRHSVKDEKTEKEKKENMIISFHPSSKTDKLFRPVKNFLAHCNPETKINLEYYSSNNSVCKGGMKHRQVQTKPEEFKKSLGSSVFVEKTKSFMTDKTNRMKRLKQCFYSPCNSIVAKTRSEITIKNKVNENFCENAKHATVPTNIPEEPQDIYLYEKCKWTSSNKFDSSDWDKSSDDKIKSDFLTVTKQGENKVINHKIFEIKHKKGFGDIRFTKLPRQSPFVYSAYDIRKTKNNSADPSFQAEPLPNEKNFERFTNDNELVKKITIKKEERSSSQSSSSASVYFTPFILVPPGREDDTSDESKYADDMPVQVPKNLEGETGDKAVDAANASANTENPVLGKMFYGASSMSDDSTLTKSSESVKESVPLKQDKGVGSGNLSSIHKYMFGPEEAPSHTDKVSRKMTSSSMIDVSQNTSKSLNNISQTAPPQSRATDLFDSSFYDKKPESKPMGTIAILNETRERLKHGTSNSVQVQTDAMQKKEVLLVYDGIKNVADKITQTVAVITRNVQVETMATKKNKSQMTYWTMAKSVQTSFTLSDSRSQSQEEECIDSEPNVTFAATSCTRPVSDRDAKIPWKKSHSDGVLYNDQKGNLKSENLIAIHHHICLCENSESSNSESENNSYEKISKPAESSSKENDTKPVVQNQIEQRPSAIRKNLMSKGEQTSLSDLSELARMVDQFFDKMSREAFKSCECDKIKKKESIFIQEIQADSSKSVKILKTLMVDAEVQTTFKVIVDPSEEKIKASSAIDPQDNSKIIFVCKSCRRKVNAVEPQTTDSLEKTQITTSKVLCISVGTSTDGLDVAKRSIGICVSDHNLVNCFVKKTQLCMSECLSTNDLYKRLAAKPSMCKTGSFFIPLLNNESGKEWAKSVTNVNCPAALGQSAPKDESKNYPQNSAVKERPTTSNQMSEKKIKNPQSPDDWKCPNFSLLSETYEKRTISKPADTCKPKAVPGRVKSGIPTAANNPRKITNFREREPEETKLNAQVIFAHGTEKQTLKPQKDPFAPTMLFNRNTVCICDHVGNSEGKLPKPKTNTEPSSNVSKACDQKPPLPTRQQPGGSKTNRNTPTQTSSKKPSGSKRAIILPAIISPIWYKDFRKTLQMIKSCSGHFQDSKKSLLKQKRFWEEEDDDLPGGKKIKGKYDGSGESCGMEQSTFASNGRQNVDIRDSAGFVWVPSSSLQLLKTETHSKILKSSQSESKVAKTCLQNSPLFKGLNKRTTNVLSGKTCRLKFVQVNENHPFRKLFERRLCKSPNFLKIDQKDNLNNEQQSEDSFECEPLKAKDESLIFDDKNCELANWEFSPRTEEQFLVEYSFSSGSSNSTDLSQNSDYLDDEHEAKIERTKSSFSSPPGIQANPFSNVTYGSKSFDTFWFGSDNQKK